MEPYISMIMPFGVDWAVMDWSLCEGQILSADGHAALYSLISDRYGGDAGGGTFALPDLRYRFAIGFGKDKTGTRTYALAEAGGEQTIVLSDDMMPAHRHNATTTLVDCPVDLDLSVSDQSPPSTANPVDAYLTTSPNRPFYTSQPPAPPYKRMAETTRPVEMIASAPTISKTGGGQPVEMMSPYLAVSYQIAMQGIYPIRN